MITWGLDTSHWEGTTLPLIHTIISYTGKVNYLYPTAIMFNSVAKSGAKFVLVKATDGIDNVDPAWEDTADKARSAGLDVFPFHFYEEQNPFTQVEWFLNNITGRFSGVPVIDFEVTPKNKSYVLSSLVSIGSKLIDYFHLVPLLYTSPYYLSLFGSLDITPLLVYNLWLAWWNSGFIMNCYPWAGYLARQWTSKGKLPGIKSSVDLDYMLDEPQAVVQYSKI